MKNRSEAVARVNKIELKIQELNIEKDIMGLKADINTALTHFKRKYNYVADRIIVIGKKELSLLYNAYKFLEVDSDFKLEFDDDGFISSVWGMDIYTSAVDSFIGIFGKANNITFVEEE